jgi:hypothetical protein
MGSTPEVSPEGVSFRVCPAVRLGSPRVDPEIPGPPAVEFGAWAFPSFLETSDGDVEIVATPRVVNEVLYVLWQSGRLARWSRERVSGAAMPRQVRDLAFRLDGFEPRLPPVVTAVPTEGGAGAWRVRVGDVALGRFDGRTVVANGEVLASAEPDERGVRLLARVTDPRVDCADETSPGRWRFTPCLSDLLPAVRGRPEAGGSFVLDDELLSALARFEFHGVGVALSGVRASLGGAPAGLRLSARAATSVR